MSDDEDYNSEEDLDYVPSEGEQVSEEENSGEEEDLSVLQDGETQVKEGTKRRHTVKKKKPQLTARKRKGGIKLEGESEDANCEGKELSEEESKRKKELAEQIAQEEEERKKDKEKKRADDLWSSFMSDVKKPPARQSNSSSTGSGLGSLSSCQVKAPSTQNKVTITKVFDFAGEEVKVTKEVDADSKEAQDERKKQEKASEETKAEKKDEIVKVPEKEVISLPISKADDRLAMLTQPSLNMKRPATGGLGSVLNKIGKKSKMGTLEKSKLDWESFKTKEGIHDDLKIHNKGKQGYTERMAFLNRTDQRQFEQERDLRLGTSSKR